MTALGFAKPLLGVYVLCVGITINNIPTIVLAALITWTYSIEFIKLIKYLFSSDTP